MLPLVEILIGAFKDAMDFSNKVLDHVDEEKYAKAVCELYGKEPTYKELDTAIEIIKEDKSLPTAEKIQLLTLVSNHREELYEKALARKKKHADIIDRGSRRKGETAVKIVGAVATGGVSLLPDAVKAIKGTVDKKSLADKAEAFEVGDVEEDDE
jgi:hypothetical protein